MYEAIASNKRRTIYLMIFFVALITGLAYLASLYFGNVNITIIAIVAALIYAVVQYFLAAKLALAVNGAKEIQRSDNPDLFNIVQNLSIADGLPMPKVYIMDDPSPNAFATGRDPDHAAVAVTSGLLEIMNKTELEGVLAHEMSHVKNYDIRVMMIVVGLAGAVGFIADIVLRFMWFGGDDRDEQSPLVMIAAIVAAIIAPLVAMLVQLAISRRREYLADSSGALLTRYPQGLENALIKIRDHGAPMRTQNTATAHLFFANPLRGSSFLGLMSTHPPIDDRIAKLRKMESKL
ncbi:MAG TPA: M48 family metalloprotease [Candidatus Saccharimonadales bacterium]|nr:M48 family metalloprotease [Candidatus Saccharimonadales bacterium]